MDKRTMKRVAVIAAGGMLMGCLFPCGCLCDNPCAWISGVVTSVGTEFLLDNDAVFDLFQDDFGTGTQYDDRFLGDDATREEPADAALALNVGD
jgi:hypothetical protein